MSQYRHLVLPLVATVVLVAVSAHADTKPTPPPPAPFCSGNIAHFKDNGVAKQQDCGVGAQKCVDGKCVKTIVSDPGDPGRRGETYKYCDGKKAVTKSSIHGTNTGWSLCPHDCMDGECVVFWCNGSDQIMSPERGGAGQKTHCGQGGCLNGKCATSAHKP